MKHGDRADVNRDIVGLGAANFAAGFTGTFVVNGSPTKTQILDEQKGRTQLANMTMSAVVLLVVLFSTGLLKDMPKAVLAGIVFLIGLDLIDTVGLRRILARRPSEFLIAVITGVIGLRRGASSRASSSRSCCPSSRSSVASTSRRTSSSASAKDGTPSYHAGGARARRANRDSSCSATTPISSMPTPADSSMTSRRLVEHAPDPVRWIVLDAGALDDIDYSAGISLSGLLDYLDARDITFALARADDALLHTLDLYELRDRIPDTQVFGNLADAVRAFERASSTTA